ncbi:MAG: NAD(P)H-dependent oxidoreductase [Saprospiraceae bacterium]|nr:NAD(P)H-dependent oxidoreductase [Saprospiraceae bacterium]
MITIISGTNRPNSRTEFAAQYVFDLIGKFTDEEVNLIKLSELDSGFVHSNMYSADAQHPALSEIQDKYIIPAHKWIMLSPEYNGSYSGIGKVFVDALSVRKYGETFRGKKLGLIGVASGRSGNLRGLDHLTTAFNYLGMIVYPNRLPISQIETLIEDDKFKESMIEELNSFLEGFVKF